MQAAAAKTMSANSFIISSNFSSVPHTTPRVKTQNLKSINFSLSNRTTTSKFSTLLQPDSLKLSVFPIHKRVLLLKCNSIFQSKDSKDPVLDDNVSSELKSKDDVRNLQEGRDWTTSILLSVFWGGLMYYVFNFAPNQTPSRDMYFLEKLLNLRGDDGFVMNEVLVSVWYIMGVWPLAYSMLLLPAGRSSKSSVPVWPFLILSCFFGAYALLPYFVLWKPPPPPVDKTELSRWPLNFLESKITAGVSLATGLGLFVYAGLAGSDVWVEFLQYFRESKFIHITCIDFTLLSAFAPFWVYNDMTARKWFHKGSWLLPVSLVPFLGPALYLFLRPSLSEMPVSVSETSWEQE